ncbi:MAG: translation initiation factor IF-3 [delta proteobacterium MLS_D]|nr:MAG: translation initiation factor IF-3 [delta proteobacterium MLS_D]
MAKNSRINSEITADEVRIIGGDGEQLGIMKLADALARAESEGYDLVEVAPNASPPVCRIMNYGKFKYQQSKKIHLARKSQTTVQLKEVRLRPKTEAHDLEVKMKNMRRFLEQSNKVKVTVLFRGREIVYADLARATLRRIAEQLSDLGVIDQEPRLEGRRMVMIVSPRKQ